MNKITNRVERKYLITAKQYDNLINFFPENYTSEYYVKSEYYDTQSLHFYHSAQDGDLNRVKYRVRTYNKSFSDFFTEKKIKRGSITEKLRGKSNSFCEELNPGVKLYPTVEISYLRKVLKNKAHERITIDQKIKFNSNRFKHTSTLIPKLLILELKNCDHMSYRTIKILNSLDLHEQKFSKYVRCMQHILERKV